MNWTNRKVGGAEDYLDHLLPCLAAAGHEVALWHETSLPTDRPGIAVPDASPAWNASELGVNASLNRLGDWRPDVLYAHGMIEPGLEERVLDAAPGVFFPHGYYGTCISGRKAFTFPTVRPCARRFGWACLALYYPRRTGGLSPGALWREYNRQSRRLALLKRYVALVTNSEHMRTEYLRHGFAPDRVHTIRYFIAGPARSPDRRRTGPLSNLIFVGRMDHLKGGTVLLDALSAAASQLGRPLRLTFVGDGPARQKWQALAEVTKRARDVSVQFAGWLARDAREAVYDSADLLVMPSLWPEPFGRVGPEAGLRGLPAAAFDVGGIRTWLEDGVNGHCAPGDRPSSEGLAEAIVRCLADPQHYARLSAGAVTSARRFGISQHLADLEPVLRAASGA